MDNNKPRRGHASRFGYGCLHPSPRPSHDSGWETYTCLSCSFVASLIPFPFQARPGRPRAATNRLKRGQPESGG